MKPFTFVKHKLLRPIFLLLLLLTLAALAGCTNRIDYFDYVSELRSNIFLAESDGFSLRVYAVTKETPYLADGIPKECSTRLEAYMVAPEGDKTCNITLSLRENTYGGEMSYDNVKAEYYFSCTLDVSSERELPFEIEYGEQKFTLCARSVLTEDTLTPKNVLTNLEREENELFSSLTDKYGFTGEIYLRLIYEDAPYYYVGLIERNGNVHAFLINAKTGKILAKRSS